MDSEITQTSQRVFEIAKFAFGVSITSIGLFVTLAETLDKPWNYRSYTSLTLFALSAVFSLLAMMPSLIKLSEDPDLQKVYATMVKRAFWTIWTWGAIWLVGVIFFVVALAS